MAKVNKKPFHCIPLAVFTDNGHSTLSPNFGREREKRKKTVFSLQSARLVWGTWQELGSRVKKQRWLIHQRSLEVYILLPPPPPSPCPLPFQHISLYPLCFPLRRPRRLQRHPGGGAHRGRRPQSHLRGQQAPVHGVVMATAPPQRKHSEQPAAHIGGVLQLPGLVHRQPDGQPLRGVQMLRPPPFQRKGIALRHKSGCDK